MKDNVLYDKEVKGRRKMRKILILIIFIFGSHFLFAGDIANFVNIGFSGDSRYFMFAQYGMTDSAVYSDIYTVDVLNNSFVQNGVNSKEYPVKAYSMDDGTGAFYKGLLASSQIIQKFGIDTLLKGRSLYVNINGDPIHVLEFRDFKTGKTYKINLQEKSEIKSSVYESSFSLNILVEKEGLPSKVYSAGSPTVKRKGIKGYNIKTIFLSPDEKNMVLVIEKTEVNKDSVSIRYMVETLPLQ